MERDDKRRRAHISRRAVLLGGAQLAVFGLLAARLYQLQVTDAEKWQLLALENRIRQRLILPERGAILDRNGQALALNRRIYHLIADPHARLALLEEADALAHLTGLSASEIRRILQQPPQQRGTDSSIILKSRLSLAELSRIAPSLARFPGLDIHTAQERYYPHGLATAHLVGYIGAVTTQDLYAEPEARSLLRQPGMMIGRNGLERSLEPTLRGRPGLARMETDARGRHMRVIDQQSAKAGADISLTLDLRLQAHMQRRLADEISASALTLHLPDGAILAAASHPGFDANLFIRGLSRQDWQEIARRPGAPLTHKAFSGQYPPGSTFKMVTALAALQAGVITPEERVFCTGHRDLGTQRFHCWRRGGHGAMTLHEALVQSCDSYFYELAYRLGMEPIKAMALKLGLGQAPNLPLAGLESGLIPDDAWKRQRIGTGWRSGDSFNAAIGQGYVLATPLQLAIMTANLVNGGQRVQPTLMPDQPDFATAERVDIGINPAHLARIKAAMDDVTLSRRGTAHPARIMEAGLEMGGKTGTSQVTRITQAQREEGYDFSNLPWEQRHHALFVGYAPVHAPRFVTAVVVEHGGGGASVAAPLARDLLLESQKIMQQKPELPDLPAHLHGVDLRGGHRL